MKKAKFERLFQEEIQKHRIGMVSSHSFSPKLAAICLNIDFNIYFPAVCEVFFISGLISIPCLVCLLILHAITSLILLRFK